MFDSCLLDSAGSFAVRRRSPWSAVSSFSLQSALVALLMLLPLRWLPGPPPPLHLEVPRIYPRGMRMVELAATPWHPATRRAAITAHGLVAPGHVPAHTWMGSDAGRTLVDPAEAPCCVDLSTGGLPDGIAGAVPTPLPEAALQPARPAAPPTRIPVSLGVAAGMLVYSVAPPYPELAKLAHISGEVSVQAIIGRDGRLLNLRAISGHPLLVEAALNAVRQWRYRPYLLNGQPVEVETQITVNFTLAR
jgi:protein TonB